MGVDLYLWVDPKDPIVNLGREYCLRDPGEETNDYEQIDYKLECLQDKLTKIIRTVSAYTPKDFIEIDTINEKLDEEIEYVIERACNCGKRMMLAQMLQGGNTWAGTNPNKL